MNSTGVGVLVSGATGLQGGATATALLAAGIEVRALVRDPDSAAAKALAGKGVELAKGDMNDPDSLVKAMAGMYAVFSVQRPDSDGSDSECRHGFNLIEAARKADVQHFVHTSVCEAGNHAQFPGWDEGRWYKKYWTDKWDIEEAVRNAGFHRWTILKPAFMMDNFAKPKSIGMFPHLREGRIVSSLLPQTRLQLIAGDDVGAFACAAIRHPDVFDRKSIDLAAESLTMDEVAEILSRCLKKPVVASSVTEKEAITAGVSPGWVKMQGWINNVGYQADISALSKYQLPLTDFETWVKSYSDQIEIAV